MKAIGWIVLVLLPLAACGKEPDYPRRSAPAAYLEDAVNIAVGRALFLEKCAYCHGTLAEGRIAVANSYTPPPADFTDPGIRRKDPAYLYWRIETGKQVEPYRSGGSVMPAWGPYLNEQQIWQLVAYLRARPAPTAGQ